jgi:hypothetical protein
LTHRSNSGWDSRFQPNEFYPTNVFRSLDKRPISEFPATYIILRTKLYYKICWDGDITIKTGIHEAPNFQDVGSYQKPYMEVWIPIADNQWTLRHLPSAL